MVNFAPFLEHERRRIDHSTLRRSLWSVQGWAERVAGMTPDGASARAEGWEPVNRSRTYELVLDRIEEQIASGRLGAGDRLPSERDLAAALEVSRVAVREALRVLHAMGVITQGTGSGPDSGTVLSAAPGAALTRLIRLHVVMASVGSQDVVRARIALERESTRLAAVHASPADRAAIVAHLEAMDDPAITPEEFNDQDTAFHVAIAQASGNPLVAEMTTALRNAMRTTLLHRLTAAADFPGVARRLCGEHHGIYQALLEGNGAKAADLVEEHIASFYAVDPQE